MSDWTAGYVADIGYTFGYYTELNPLRLRLPLLSSGYAFPNVESACELGFGQGVSVNMHAAASSIAHYGTDFNPAQANFAQELARQSGARLHLHDEAFAEFCNRSDLPDFDYIGLHGIWSWISDENRSVIVDFIRRKLKVGGVLYISYNTQPGWAAMLPMRGLLTEHAQVMAAPGQGIVSRIDSALDFAERLLATDPIFGRVNPVVGERIKRMKDQNRSYLAHEYFNRDWHPMTFSRMAEWLAGAKLNFACSAHYVDHVDAVNLSTEQQAFLKEIPDAMFREAVRDFMCNTQFRRDYWIKGGRRLNPVERVEALRQQQVILVNSPENVELKVSGYIGDATLNEGIYCPLLEAMSDHKPKTLNQLEQMTKAKGLSLPQILQAVMILVGKNDLAPVQDELGISKAKKQCDKLNAHLLQASRGSHDVGYLAAPLTGAAVPVNRFQQMFLLAKNNGRKSPEECVKFAWEYLENLNQRLTKEGKALETPEENIAELQRQAVEFFEKRLPILKALMVT
ncbi:class I SAM-dependent methyltransferase [Noviherbaspirillum denitrificans]|uniref:Methyltransferase n=1 Tax=Noviherbaspirillum denitrificans TaxID=1968433 RepID=A0A254TH36_9BURK|nr:class I SAM-dependent methyltransferase [Noviherbaspirillum denitrificans]OWW18998.1 methyltransferase [Noviherbaspirillum denitrificans]